MDYKKNLNCLKLSATFNTALTIFRYKSNLPLQTYNKYPFYSVERYTFFTHLYLWILHTVTRMLLVCNDNRHFTLTNHAQDSSVDRSSREGKDLHLMGWIWILLKRDLRALIN